MRNVKKNGQKRSIVCIIQARMGSTRLPGKVLLPLCGKEILLHVVDRVLQSKKIQKIIVATTENSRDETIVRLLSDYNPRVVVERGSEEDVLDRYYEAAKKHEADMVVRAMGENLFVDPEIIDGVIGILEDDEELDYVSNSIGKHTFPRGLDVECLTFKALKRCWEEGNEGMDREHVTVYIKRSPDRFKVKSYENDIDLSHHRWTIDEKDDYILAKSLYDRIYRRNPAFRMKDILDILDREPSLSRINYHVKHKNPQY